MNIQTRAHRTHRKPKKEEAQAVIEAIYNGTPATQEELAALYKYFMPAMPAKCKDLVQWVAKARSTDQTRRYLTQSYCDGQHLIATDGHRMHWIKAPEGMAKGYVDDKGAAIDIDGTFPDWQRVIPQAEHSKEIHVQDLEATKRDRIMCYNIGGAYFNKKYIDDILNGDTSATVRYTDGPRDPIRFEFEDGRNAVVMPVRVK